MWLSNLTYRWPLWQYTSISYITGGTKVSDLNHKTQECVVPECEWFKSDTSRTSRDLSVLCHISLGATRTCNKSQCYN